MSTASQAELRAHKPFSWVSPADCPGEEQEEKAGVWTRLMAAGEPESRAFLPPAACNVKNLFFKLGQDPAIKLP